MVISGRDWYWVIDIRVEILLGMRKNLDSWGGWVVLWIYVDFYFGRSMFGLE